MASGQLLVLVLLVFTPIGTPAQETACLPDVRLAEGEEHCLGLIQQKAADTSAFPFSAPFSTLCPPETRDTDPDCFFVPARLPVDQPYSLRMLLFGRQSSAQHLQSIDRYLTVKYTSPPGSYSGCDSTYTSVDEAEFELDPLSDSSVQAWYTRQMPELQWRAENGEFFTLVLVDPESMNVQLGIINIRGNDLTSGLVFKDYANPGNFRSTPDVYTFILYRQTRQLSVPTVTFDRFIDFNASRFEEVFNLEGPVALNWVMVEADASTVGPALGGINIQHCASLIQKELERGVVLGMPYVTQPFDLTVYLRVRFTTQPLTYKCGLLSITHPGNDFFLDPLADPVIYSADVGQHSVRSYSMQMDRISPNSAVDFLGKLYTLLFISPTRSVKYGLMINARGPTLTEGTVIEPYIASLPRTPYHKYYFLLFEQKGVLAVNSTDGITKTTCNADRCLDGVLEAFVKMKELQLVGATWMTVTDDDHSLCRQNEDPANGAGVPCAQPSTSL